VAVLLPGATSVAHCVERCTSLNASTSGMKREKAICSWGQVLKSCVLEIFDPFQEFICDDNHGIERLM
jgi:hypothetical protein